MEAAASNIDYKVLHDELQVKYAAVLHQLDQLKKMIFASKQERFVATDANKPNPQLSLELDAETIAHCKLTDASKVEYVRTKTELTERKPRVHPGRMKLPEHLRRETTVLSPDIDVTGLQKIGEDITEILDFTPGELFVKQFIRPRFVRPAVADSNTGTVITASLPGRMMEKCMAGEGLLAQIAVDKYMDHLPLHRILQRLARAGVIIAQSTINDWVKNVLILLTALYELHKQQILSSGYLHADETRIQVLDDSKKARPNGSSGRGKTHRGFYWVYYSSELKAALFEYQEGRGREGPNAMLKDYKGYLQTDGYTGYDELAAKKDIVHLCCMAHARRYFFEANGNDALREHALKMFQQLYAIEAQITEKGLQGGAKLEMRQTHAVPILKEMKTWLTEEYKKNLHAGSIGKALEYALQRWDKLSLYTTDPRLNIDNNPVENAIRPVAIGRKNYLFAGSHEAAQRAAMIYSLFATCRHLNINPYEWLIDVLKRMHTYKSSTLHELLPQNWKKPEAKDQPTP